MQRPDVLVLGAGGQIGADWMAGVLAGIREAAGIDFRATEAFVGTSAGSMLAADLLAGQEPRPPAAVGETGEGDAAAASDPGAAPVADSDLPAEDPSADGITGDGLLAHAGRVAGGLAGVVGRPLAPLALAAAAPGGRLARAAALARIAPPDASLDHLRERIAAHALRFDGRLRVVCVEREGGRRVVFGAPGAPPASVAEAVQASCSVPWTHQPVRIDEREYVDGAIWSPTNLDVAPARRGTHVLCLAPTGGVLRATPRHPAVRAAIATVATLETLALRRRGAVVQLIAPEAGAGADPRLAGYRQGLALDRGT